MVESASAETKIGGDEDDENEDNGGDRDRKGDGGKADANKEAEGDEDEAGEVSGGSGDDSDDFTEKDAFRGSRGSGEILDERQRAPLLTSEENPSPRSIPTSDPLSLSSSQSISHFEPTMGVSLFPLLGVVLPCI